MVVMKDQHQPSVSVHQNFENQDPASVGLKPGKGESMTPPVAPDVPKGTERANAAARSLARGPSGLRANSAEEVASPIGTRVRVPELDKSHAEEVRGPEEETEEVRGPEDLTEAEPVSDDDVPSEALPLIAELSALADLSQQTQWRVALLALRLVEEHGVKQVTLARRLGRSEATISEWLKAARLGRDIEVKMPDYQERLGVHKAKEIKANWSALPKVTRDRRSIIEFATDSIIKPSRQVRREWSDEEQDHANKENEQRAEEVRASEDIGGRVCPEPMSCIAWMEAEAKVNPNSYRVLYGDVPYIYTTYDKLPVDTSQVSGLRVDCDSAKYEEALKLSTDIIERAGTLLTEPDEENIRGGGVLLLMQAGGQYVLPEILEAVERAGMVIRHTIQIDTGFAKLANPASPYGRSSETLLVISRKAELVRRCDTRSINNTHGTGNPLSPHTSVISECQLRTYIAQWQLLNKKRLWRFHPTGNLKANASKQRRSATAVATTFEEADAHLFQKNEAQLALVLGKHCLPGDLIADLCGCSASCCIAADQMGVEWRYIESNLTNYNFGLNRLRRYFEAKAEGFGATEEDMATWELELLANRMNTTETLKLLRRLSGAERSQVAAANEKDELER